MNLQDTISSFFIQTLKLNNNLIIIITIIIYFMCFSTLHSFVHLKKYF